MTNKRKYLGITIGPIANTIAQAQKTREFWLGSYFFSHVMKRIVQKVQSYGEILAQDISTIDDEVEKLHGAGIYSDRCYVLLNKEFTQENYNELVDDVINEVKVEDKEALREYLQIYVAIQEVPENENFMKALNQQLDVMELQSRYYPENIYVLASGYQNLNNLRAENEKIILPTTVNGLIQEWYKMAFEKDDLIEYKNIKGGVLSFPSLLEIATKGLERKNPELYKTEIHPEFEKSLGQEMNEKTDPKDKMTDTDILHLIRNIFKDDFQTAHKYIAIVNADGDKVGTLINDTAAKNDKALLNSLTKNVSDFSKAAAQIVYEYGGKPVYIGGDDLLFFAPVVSYEKNESKHIFQLIQALEEKFNEMWTKWLSDNSITNTKPSLSYGMSITYYKYPLNEAMNLSNNLLFNHAKKDPKNQLAIQVMTHSGSFDEVVLDKGGNSSFSHLLKLLARFGEKEEDREAVINSVLQRLRNDTPLLLAIAQDQDSFRAYFTNEYDLHKMKDHRKKDFIEHSIALFDEICKKHEKKEEALNELCTIYRLLNFLIHKETGNNDGNEIQS